MLFLRIVLLCICAAIVYGIAHDLVTANVCVEYFTIGHPIIIPTEDPTTLALLWGIIATWWVGLLLGLPLACAARIGSWPKISARELFKPIFILLAAMAFTALLAGSIGAYAAQQKWVYLIGRFASDVPVDRHVRFLADLWAHTASYGTGFLGGLVLIVLTLLQRRRAAAKIAP